MLIKSYVNESNIDMIYINLFNEEDSTRFYIGLQGDDSIKNSSLVVPFKSQKKIVYIQYIMIIYKDGSNKQLNNEVLRSFEIEFMSDSTIDIMPPTLESFIPGNINANFKFVDNESGINNVIIMYVNNENDRETIIWNHLPSYYEAEKIYNLFIDYFYIANYALNVYKFKSGTTLTLNSIEVKDNAGNSKTFYQNQQNWNILITLPWSKNYKLFNKVNLNLLLNLRYQIYETTNR